MRAKILIAALFLAIALLGIVTWFSEREVRSKKPGVRSANSNFSLLTTHSSLPPSSITHLPSQQPIASSAEEIHSQKIRQRIAELNDLAMNSDTNSLNTILAELNNSDKEIRKGALEAVIQFADRAAIARLQEIADRTEDATEKAALLEAIEYLKLPSLTEYLREKGKTR